MIFGWAVTPLWMLILGLSLFTLIVFQIAVGERWVKFGRRTFVYHRYVAYVILGIAVVHLLFALLFLYGWTVF